MKNSIVAGVGFHPFGRFLNKSIKELAASAVLEAVRDAGISLPDIGAAYVGNSYAGLLTGQESVRGQVILRYVGLSGIPVVNVENACASGSTAFHQALLAVQSGMTETALVLGVEKLFVNDTRKSIRALSSSADVELTANSGMQFTALYAMKARRVMEHYNIPIEAIARISVKNSLNGILNPIAQFKKPQSIESVLSSRMISEPLTLLMCSSIADGAAAVILMNEKKARQVGVRTNVYVKGCVLRSGEYQRKEDVGELDAVRKTAKQAYEEAGIGCENIDVMEVHDAAASSEMEHLVSLGVTHFDEGYESLLNGEFDLSGSLPVNPSGGLISRGHPTGATGVAQIGEIVIQLRHEAKQRQVNNGKKIKTGLCLNTGGRVEDDRGAIVCTILSL